MLKPDRVGNFLVGLAESKSITRDVRLGDAKTIRRAWTRSIWTTFDLAHRVLETYALPIQRIRYIQSIGMADEVPNNGSVLKRLEHPAIKTTTLRRHSHLLTDETIIIRLQLDQHTLRAFD